MSFALVIGLVTAVGAFFSFRAPTGDEMVASFAEAQRFYAEGAYDQAIERYSQVAKVHSRVLDAATIQVEVGENAFPVREAALYQTGNSHVKLFADSDRFSAGSETATARDEYRILADSAFSGAVQAFERIIAKASNPMLQGQAHGRLIELYFDAGDYGNVIRSARRLIDTHGGDSYALVGYYNLGWAYYERGEYAEAIDAFETLLRHYPSGYRTDRSLFQIGESYLAMDQCESAIASYQRLVARQRIDELGAEELLQMKREKLAGLVDETALELVAKAEIRIGTCYGKLQDFDEGVAAFRRVIDLFASERVLVEESYLRLADLYADKGDDEGALNTYREAIDAASDRTLRARIQYALAERLFAQARYEEALAEYRIYLQGYGDIVGSAGFSADRVRYRMGSSYQQMAQQHVDEDAAGKQPWLERAIAQYDTILVAADSPYVLDARFNRALAWHALGDRASQEKALGEYEDIVGSADSLYAQRALLQLGELHFARQEFAQAVERMRQLLEDYPASDLRDEAQMRLALALQGQGQLEGAIEVFVRVGTESPYFSRARMGAGHALLQRRQFERAALVLTEGVERAEPEQLAGYYYLLGQAEIGRGDHLRAMEQFTTGLANDPDASLQEAMRLTRGNAALVLGDLAQGEEDMRWIVEQVRDAEKVKFAQEALSLFYLRQDRSGDALALLEQMLQRTDGPRQEAELLSRILDLYYERDDFEQTQLIARRILELSFADGPSQTRPYTLREKTTFILGDAIMRAGDAVAAVDIFERELARDADGFFAVNMRLNLATHFFATGALEEARAAFIVLDGTELPVEQKLLVRFYLANVHYTLREFDDSRQIFADLLEDFPQADHRSGMLFGLGESHYQMGNFAEAIGFYRRLLQEFPEDDSSDDAQYNMAWCLIELDQEEEAMATFARLLERYPNSEFAPSVQFTFGDHAYNRGAYEEALAAYSKVLERYPQAEVVAQVPRLQRELKEAIAYDEYEQGLALLDSAEAQKSARYFQEAIAVFDRVLQQYPGTESAIGSLSNKGVCLEGLGRWQAAVEVYDEVIQLYEREKATRDAYQFAKAHREWIVTSRL
jgi:tetratricopeptide (TPR) repeat protein